MTAWAAMLAQGDYEGLKLGLMVVSLIVSVLSSFGVLWIGVRERARCRKEDQWAATILSWETKLAGAESKGEQLVERLVEERIRAASHEVNNHVTQFVNALNVLKEQASASAEQFKELNEADHANRLTLATQIAQLQNWMGERFAEKVEHRALDAQVRRMDTDIAVLRSRASGKAG